MVDRRVEEEAKVYDDDDDGDHDHDRGGSGTPLSSSPPPSPPAISIDCGASAIDRDEASSSAAVESLHDGVNLLGPRDERDGGDEEKKSDRSDCRDDGSGEVDIPSDRKDGEIVADGSNSSSSSSSSARRRRRSRLSNRRGAMRSNKNKAACRNEHAERRGGGDESSRIRVGRLKGERREEGGVRLPRVRHRGDDGGKTDQGDVRIAATSASEDEGRRQRRDSDSDVSFDDEDDSNNDGSDAGRRAAGDAAKITVVRLDGSLTTTALSPAALVAGGDGGCRLPATTAVRRPAVRVRWCDGGNDGSGVGGGRTSSVARTTGSGRPAPSRARGRGGIDFDSFEWDETNGSGTVVLPVDYEADLLDRPGAVLLFEVLEGVSIVAGSSARAVQNVNDNGNDEGGTEGGRLRRVAWGFLRPRGKGGDVHVGVRRNGINNDDDNDCNDGEEAATSVGDAPLCRLQLYRWRGGGRGASFRRSTTAVMRQCRAAVSSLRFRRTDQGRPFNNGFRSGNGQRARADVPQPPPQVYLQYLRRRRIKLPASLVVAVSPIAGLTERPRGTATTTCAGKSMDRHPGSHDGLEKRRMEDGEGASRFSCGNVGNNDEHKEGDDDAQPPVDRFKREPHEPCLIPNVMLRPYPAGTMGATSIAFGRLGAVLAIAVANADGADGGGCVNPIWLCAVDVESDAAAKAGVLHGHCSIIYDLAWSVEDRYLVSASADGTVKVWCVGVRGRPLQTGASETKGAECRTADRATSSMSSCRRMESSPPHLLQTLRLCPPTFAYCAAFAPCNDSSLKGEEGGSLLVFSGSYDGAVRLWDGQTGTDLGELGDGIDENLHTSQVNALAVDDSIGRVYSGDGDGCIIVWKSQPVERMPEVAGDYVALRRLLLKELRCKAITSLSLSPRYPGGRGQVLIAAKASPLLIFDLSSQRVLSTSYAHSGYQCKGFVRATFSPDGRYISCSPDGTTIRVWSATTGEIQFVFDASRTSVKFPLSSVCWHHTRHRLMWCSYMSHMPVASFGAES